MIVTIDGPAGSGKSTAAKALAARLGFEYLDTGAMYRAVALAVIRRGLDPSDSAAVVSILPSLTVEMPPGEVVLNGENVAALIRTPQVSDGASKVSAIKEVRDFLVPIQRQIAAARRMVCEGRDQGTVVFPDAEFKFYLDADPHIRARRRSEELHAAGQHADFDTVLKGVIERDHRDRTRADGPLRQPPDAIVIDTTALSPEEVIAEMERRVRG
jgi:cytidylate kinase